MQGVALVGVPVALPMVLLLAIVGKRGGQGLAEELGGTRSSDYVVRAAHEAATAVGVSPPSQVYTIPSAEANAFAAGGFLGSAPVVGVTQGLLDRLDQRELKAVLAHEMG